MKNENIKSADKKPQVYTDPDTGRRKVRMVPVDRDIIKTNEKAVSQAQQKMMGMALAYKRGELDDASPEVKKLSKSMSIKDLEDFAKTKHKGLPMKKEVDENRMSPLQQIDELSIDKLKAYRKKAVDDVASNKKAGQRAKGVERSSMKIRRKQFSDLYSKKERKESVEQIDEISAKLARRAAASSDARAYDYSSSAYDDETQKYADHLSKKADKALAHVKKRQGDKGIRKTNRLSNKLIYGKSRYSESVELDEAKEHPAYNDLMKLAKDLDGRDTRAIQVMAGKISNFTSTGNRGNIADLGKYFKALDSYPRDAFISIMKKHDKALLKSIAAKAGFGIKEEVEVDEGAFKGVGKFIAKRKFAKKSKQAYKDAQKSISKAHKYNFDDVKNREPHEKDFMDKMKKSDRYNRAANRLNREEVEIDEAKGTGVKKFVKGMRVAKIHNPDMKGTVIKGGDNMKKGVEVEWDSGTTTVASGKYLMSISKNESVDLGEKLERDGPNRSKNFARNFGVTARAHARGGKTAAYLDKKVKQRQAMNKKNDPGADKKGLALTVIDREKAQAKRMKNITKKEDTNLDEKKYVVKYTHPNYDKSGKTSGPLSKAAADKKAAMGNKVDKVGGKYTVIPHVEQANNWGKSFFDIREGRGGQGEEGERHIINQLRKAQDVGGNHTVKFRRGDAKVDGRHIDAILHVHDSLKKNDDKRRLALTVWKSHDDLKKVAGSFLKSMGDKIPSKSAKNVIDPSKLKK